MIYLNLNEALKIIYAIVSEISPVSNALKKTSLGLNFYDVANIKRLAYMVQ